jgi:ketosteroid isomerase-like protein
MTIKRNVIWVSILICAIFVAAPVLAADQSDLAGRAVTWVKEYNADNLNGVVALYAADGCRMPPNAETVHGSDGILAQLKTGKTQGAAKIKVVVTSAESMGDTGWGSGTYELMGADGTAIDSGKWMNVSKKVKGTWKIQCDIWNSNKPLPPSPKQ